MPASWGVQSLLTLSLPEQARSSALLLMGWPGCLLVKEVSSVQWPLAYLGPRLAVLSGSES